MLSAPSSTIVSYTRVGASSTSYNAVFQASGTITNGSHVNVYVTSYSVTASWSGGTIDVLATQNNLLTPGMVYGWSNTFTARVIFPVNFSYATKSFVFNPSDARCA